MVTTSHELKQLRHRFVEDTDAPISVLESPFFEERIELFEKDFGTKTAYENYFKHIETTYNGNINLFLEDYHSLRDKIIDTVSQSESFKQFNCDKKIDDAIRNNKPSVGNINLYTNEQVNSIFISIDMKKANFQALKIYNPLIVDNAATYEEFIGKYTDFDLAKKSKRTRQIIFGRLNPKRTMNYEKFLMCELENQLTSQPFLEDFELFSINSDEILYKAKKGAVIDNIMHVCETLCHFIKQISILDIRVEAFTLRNYTFRIHDSKKSQTVYIKYYFDGRKAYKCANLIYFTQTYKLINGIEITDNDLVFYNDNTELAKFLCPLEIDNNRQ